MPATLSDKGQELLADLPSYYADDPSQQAAQDSLGRELERLEAAAQETQRGFLPQYATEANGLLRVWEMILKLPVSPPGVTEAQRQSKVLAGFRKRNAAKGKDWVSLLSDALGTTSWDHVEEAPYGVRLIIPFSAGSYTAAQVISLAERITPANLTIAVDYDQGFVLGYSQTGVSAL